VLQYFTVARCLPGRRHGRRAGQPGPQRRRLLGVGRAYRNLAGDRQGYATADLTRPAAVCSARLDAEPGTRRAAKFYVTRADIRVTPYMPCMCATDRDYAR